MSSSEVVPMKDEENREEDEEIDMTSFWEYLKTPQGHEVATKVVGIVDDIKKLSLDRNSSHQSLETVAKYVIIGVIVAAVAGLSYFNKLDPTTGMLFGTIVGYFFGRKEAL